MFDNWGAWVELLIWKQITAWKQNANTLLIGVTDKAGQLPYQTEARAVLLQTDRRSFYPNQLYEGLNIPILKYKLI